MRSSRATRYFFKVSTTTSIYTLSLHDALPISPAPPARSGTARWPPRDCDKAGCGGRSEEHQSELQSRAVRVRPLLPAKTNVRAAKAGSYVTVFFAQDDGVFGRRETLAVTA